MSSLFAHSLQHNTALPTPTPSEASGETVTSLSTISTLPPEVLTRIVAHTGSELTCRQISRDFQAASALDPFTVDRVGAAYAKQFLRDRLELSPTALSALRPVKSLALCMAREIAPTYGLSPFGFEVILDCVPTIDDDRFDGMLNRVLSQTADLCRVDLSYNLLTALPASLLLHRNLAHLQMSGNKLADKDLVSVCSLINLKSFHLQHADRIETVPSEIAQLVRLESLTLEGAMVKRLPKEMGQLSQLQRVVLRLPMLEEISDNFAAIPSLTHVELLDCDGLQLPDDLARFYELRQRFPQPFSKRARYEHIPEAHAHFLWVHPQYMARYMRSDKTFPPADVMQSWFSPPDSKGHQKPFSESAKRELDTIMPAETAADFLSAAR